MTDYSNLSDAEKLEVIKNAVRSYPDFPKKGILFRDVFSVLSNPPIHTLLKEQLVNAARNIQPPIECVVGLDARGFLFGPIIALDLNIPFVPIRKKGKLPGKIRSYKYALEYGEDTVEIQEDQIKQGQRVLIVDDLLATGGTLKAACELVTQVGGTLAQSLVVMELVDLKGREKLPGEVVTLIQY
ncbi:adenine phosphoribosyltransferase isoform X3 [Anthonomus grandis grandis]|uniref:adenine phosphoribosyltransferase isoform X3 n=1 Tax=Anthonomus grandis grandis TaxID=2921223 RepID=UPI0021665958|nr:adenine phosphoribosyltransferase isoform X3 [Anthonomus grandis grandis]